MYFNKNSDEISPHLLTTNFNPRSFFMYHRRENERNREISFSKNNRQHSIKYSSFNNPRGFARLPNHSSSNSTISSCMISDYGIHITNEFSQQLLDDYLNLFRYHWKRSNTNFAKKIEYIQSEFNRQATISLKKTICEYEKVLSHWISKNRLK